MKKNNLWIVVGVVAAALVVWFVTKNNPGSPYYSPSPTASGSPVVSGSPKATPKPTGTAVGSTLKYNDALALYVDRRIQFDINCQAQPSAPTYKNGTAIMFDNRSGDARTITLDGKAYSFAGYGFRILTLYSSSLPHTIQLNCGSAVNVGKIILQK